MQLNDITHRARVDLVLTNTQGENDTVLWEHSVRVARSAVSISSLPEVHRLHPDEQVVYAAALYYASGWAVQVRSGRLDIGHLLPGSLNDATLEDGAALLEAHLADLVPGDKLRRAARVVRTLLQRDTDLIEATIIAEARNLEEFGLLALWPTVRKGMIEGKGIQAALDTWRRKREYHFWPARLKEAFRFDSVREIARRRLAQLEAFMEELARQHSGQDITGVKATSHDPTRRACSSS